MYSFIKPTIKDLFTFKLHDCTDEQKELLVLELLNTNTKIWICKSDVNIGAFSVLESDKGLELSVYSITDNPFKLYKAASWAVHNVDELILLDNVYLRTSTKYGEMLLKILENTGRYTITKDGEGVRVKHDRT